MVDVSRRWFLIGSAAFVAAASIPTTPTIPKLFVNQAVLNNRFDYRNIIDVMISSNAGPDTPNTATAFRLMRQDGTMIWDTSVNLPYSMLRWVAIDELHGIVVLKDFGLKIEVEPDFHQPCVNLIYNVERNPDERRKFFVETFQWDEAGRVKATPPCPLDPRDA